MDLKRFLYHSLVCLQIDANLVQCKVQVFHCFGWIFLVKAAHCTANKRVSVTDSKSPVLISACSNIPALCTSRLHFWPILKYRIWASSESYFRSNEHNKSQPNETKIFDIFEHHTCMTLIHLYSTQNEVCCRKASIAVNSNG